MTIRIYGRVAALLLALAATLTACGGKDGTTAPPPAVIAIDGSSTVFPITEAVAEDFQAANPGHRVTVGSSGTGGGFNKFCRGETAISDASRPIKETDTEMAACRAAGIDYVEIPVAYDGLAVLVHPKNTWATTMTIPELKKLWEPAATGKIMKWSQIRQGWPDREIHLFGAGVDSGTFEYFTEAINGKAKDSRGDYTSSEDDNVLVQGIAGDENALGYMGLAYYEQNKDKMKLVGIDDGKPDNGAGPILPTQETVRGGTYRPLSRPLFVYVSTKALARPEVEKFVSFYLANGGKLAREVGYVPLSDVEQQLAQARYTSKTTGTVFGGGSMKPGVTLESMLKGGSK